MGLKILGRVGAHTCIFFILKGNLPFKMHKIKKNSRKKIQNA